MLIYLLFSVIRKTVPSNTMSTEKNMQDLAALLNGHSITDDNGQVSNEESAPSEPQVEEKPVEEPVEVQPEAPKEKSEDKDIHSDDYVEDETTKEKFVPLKRFKEIYGKYKELERKASTPAKEEEPQVPGFDPSTFKVPSVPVEKTEILETELLYTTMPEFNPESGNYNKQLDYLGAQIYQANPGITKIEAARRAKTFMKSLTQQQSDFKAEARTIKASQADGPVSARPTRPNETVDPSKMSLDDMESFLKSTGQW